MRRRVEAAESTTPLRLRRFLATEWEADTELEAAGQWWDARDRWKQEHGEYPEHDSDEPMPDEPWGPELL